MIGIFQDSFVEYLKKNLGEPVNIKTSNVVCRCPWCEYGKTKKHYHLWISINAPIFHCFHCEKGGTIEKLFEKISGIDVSGSYVDKEKVKELVKEKFSASRTTPKQRKIILPEINEEKFPFKSLYMKHRLKFSNISIQNVKGLVFDFLEFVRINKIVLDDKQDQMARYLQFNFIGFVTENQSKVVFRNIDPCAGFRYYKLGLQDSQFLDYYKLPGGKRDSNTVILGEGIFDIYTEHIFDYTNLKNSVRLYAAALSTSYHSLLKSVVFHEQVFRLNVHILSDRNIRIPYFKKLKRNNDHVINNLFVYYNKSGEDFNCTPVEPERITI